MHPESRDIFITDGYGNSRVHKYGAEGNHIASWGSPGALDGQFSLPHNVCMLGDDKIVVCDRENFRIQVFSSGRRVCGPEAHASSDRVCQWSRRR